VLHSGYLDVAVHQRGGQGGLTDIFGLGVNFHHGIEVGSTEDNAGVDRGWMEGQVDFLASVETHTRGANHVVQSTLSNHALRIPAKITKNCRQY